MSAAHNGPNPPSGGIDIEIVDEILPVRLPELLALYAETWWAADRTLTDVDAMLHHSDVVVGAIDRRSNRLIGFARALTDRTYFALVLDVIVASAFRGRGLGRRLMDQVLLRPGIAAARSVELVCQPELVPFYRRFGFTDQVGRSLLMRRTADPLLARPR